MLNYANAGAWGLRRLLFAAAAFAASAPSGAAATDIAPMPASLELRYALSALPTPLRAAASVYLLDPKSGYHLARTGTSGVNCLVQRTAWELNDLRDDVYYPICFDAEGSKTYLKVIMDSASLRAQGLPAQELKAEIERRYANKVYRVPEKSGVSYMVGPVMRTLGPDRTMQTMAMPHLMFYAPGVTNDDLGAKPDPSNFSTLMNPFIDRQGNAEQSFIIQMIGDAEKAKIATDEKSLLDELCAFRDVLCAPGMKH